MGFNSEFKGLSGSVNAVSVTVLV